jgi:hypothetical protein
MAADKRALVLLYLTDKNKKSPNKPTIITGENQNGNSMPKLSKTITNPRVPIAYIAPFFKNSNLVIKSMPLMVNSLTTNAPKPLPIIIKGILIVKAKAPITPSIEKEA